VENVSFKAYEEAFRHFVAHSTMLRAYIRAIVCNAELTEDTLSDTAIEIARSWERYDPSRPFPEWARGVARRVALGNLRKAARQPALLTPEILEVVGSAIDAFGDQSHLERRKALLQKCLATLSESNRSLVELRYFRNRTYAEISQLAKRSIGALYVIFNRIHKALSECVRKNLETT